MTDRPQFPDLTKYFREHQFLTEERNLVQRLTPFNIVLHHVPKNTSLTLFKRDIPYGCGDMMSAFYDSHAEILATTEDGILLITQRYQVTEDTNKLSTQQKKMVDVVELGIDQITFQWAKRDPNGIFEQVISEMKTGTLEKQVRIEQSANYDQLVQMNIIDKKSKLAIQILNLLNRRLQKAASPQYQHFLD